MNNVVVSIRFWHEHCVNIDFAEKGEGNGNGRWNIQVLCGLCLTFVTGLQIPLDVIVEVQLPEAFEDVDLSSQNALVASVIMCLLK